METPKYDNPWNYFAFCDLTENYQLHQILRAEISRKNKVDREVAALHYKFVRIAQLYYTKNLTRV